MHRHNLSFVTALLGAAWISLSLVPAAGCAGGPSNGEGEGEAGEGEGAPAGEGEGSAAGEGEGAQAGEGEGVAGEGEGEGSTVDTVGDQTNPEDVTVAPGADFTTSVVLDNGTDEDCYRFTVSDSEVITAETSGNCVQGPPDTIINVFSVAVDGTPTFVAENDEDPRVDFGASHCSFVQALVGAGTYMACVTGFDGDVGATDFSIDVQAQHTIGAGEACVKGDIAGVCDTGLTCLADGLGANQCATPSTLAAGDACTPASEIAVCDAAAGFACQDDGSGATTCVNPSAASCAAAVEYAGAPTQVTPAGPGEGATGSCGSFLHDPEVVVHYVATQHAQVTIAAQGADNVFVRSTCDVPSTELQCDDFSTPPAPVVGDVAAGAELFAFVEAAAGTTATVTITEKPIRAAGEACDATGAADVCDATAFLACLDDGAGGSTCQNPNAIVCAAAQTMSGNDFSGTIGAQNVIAGACTSTPRSETMLAYTADAGVPLADLTVTLTVDGTNTAQAPNPALSVRTACDDPTTETQCTTSVETTATVHVGRVTGGSQLFFLVEDVNAGAPFTLHVDAVAIAVLGSGETCDTAATDSVCDPTQSLVCLDGTCQAAQGDTCDAAIALSGAGGTETGDSSSLYADDVNLGTSSTSCTGFSTKGPDVFYAVTIPAGQTLDVTMQPNGFDAALYLLDTCPFSAPNQCLDGSDAIGSGPTSGTEHVTYTNGTGADQLVFVVADAFSDHGGPYSLTWTLQ